MVSIGADGPPDRLRLGPKRAQKASSDVFPAVDLIGGALPVRTFVFLLTSGSTGREGPAAFKLDLLGKVGMPVASGSRVAARTARVGGTAGFCLVTLAAWTPATFESTFMDPDIVCVFLLSGTPPETALAVAIGVGSVGRLTASFGPSLLRFLFFNDFD
jgi:hypothetical protein